MCYCDRPHVISTKSVQTDIDIGNLMNSLSLFKTKEPDEMAFQLFFSYALKYLHAYAYAFCRTAELHCVS